jgi:adenylate kinase
VAPLLAAGALVPDEITIPLVRRVIENEGANGFILDGYPRTLLQAQALDEMLDEIGRPLSIVLLLELDDAIAVERLLKRAQIEGRPDDTPETINRRLATYHAETEPVVERYLATGKLVKLHAERTVDEVWSEIVQAFEQVEARAS